MLSTKTTSIFTVAIAFLLVISLNLYAKSEQRRGRQDRQESSPKAQIEGSSQTHGQRDAATPRGTPKMRENAPSVERNTETARTSQNPHEVFAKEAQSKNFATTAATSRRTKSTWHPVESSTDVSGTKNRSVVAPESKKQSRPVKAHTPSKVSRTVEVKSTQIKTETTSIRQEGHDRSRADLNIQTPKKTQLAVATAEKTAPSRTTITRSSRQDRNVSKSINTDQHKARDTKVSAVKSDSIRSDSARNIVSTKSNERLVSNISTSKRPSRSSIRQRFNDSAVQLNDTHASVGRSAPAMSHDRGSAPRMDLHTRGGRTGSMEHRTRSDNHANAFVNHNTSYPYVSRSHGGDRHDGGRSSINISVGFNNFNDWSRHHIGPATHRSDWNRWRSHWYYYWSTTPAYYTNYTWIRPGCGTIVYYQYNRHPGISYIYPDYHRKYVFVSIGGYWPVSYSYQRYYWYGCHPTVWYGAYPQEYVVTETNNYYTYNNYSTSSPAVESTYNTYSTPYASIEPTYGYDSSGNIVPDYDALSQVRQNLAIQQAAADMPQEKTPADEYFEKAVENFGKQDYQTAMLNIREAIRLEPNDVVLPFVYCQTLFATEDYSRAAGVLRAAVSNLPQDKKAVFFPRGLYSDESILNTQIEKLSKVAQTEVINGDLQLLLGYQLLGVSKFDEAKAILTDAARDVSNEAAANTLLELLEQAKSTATDSNVTN
jgi:hypothetical protein